jgi:DNA polymerase (family 10)
MSLMETREIAARLEEIATLLELKGENPFKVRAYQSGARALESLEEDLDTLIAEDRLEQVKGIGKALTGKITELRRSGRLAFYDKLRGSVPDGLIEMLEIPGFGPKKIRKVREALGIENIDALKAACEAGKVAELPGFGKKSEENILRGIANRVAYGKRHLWWDARAVALPLLEGLRELPQVARAEVAGSFRRAMETVGDLDFIVSASDPGPVMDWFTTRGNVAEVTAKGTTKSSVRFSGGLQADLRVVPDDRFVFALHHFTGSKDHNVQMRQRALARGLSLSEWGIFHKDEEPEDGGKAYDRPLAKSGIREEADLFHALGLEYVPPERREGIDEIEQAEAGELEAPLPLDALRGAFHNHTRASDGHHSLEEMARAAAGRGLTYLGIADHSKASFQANGLSAERLAAQIGEIRHLNKTAGKAQAWLFAGCEVDILKGGELDFDKAVLRELDYCVLSVHGSMSGQSEEEMTRRLVRALEADTGCLKILGHPTGRLLLRREGYAVNLREVIAAARDNGAMIELNANPLRMDMDWRHWRHAAELGVPCVITADAHAVEDLDYLLCGILAARKAGLTAKQVFNTGSLDLIRAALKKAKA